MSVIHCHCNICYYTSSN